MFGHCLSSSSKHVKSIYLAVDICLALTWQWPDSCSQRDCHASAKQVPSTIMRKSKSELGLDLDLSPIFFENGLDLDLT